jgi:hypothetical protein
MKCQKCGDEVTFLFKVDEDDFVPYLDDTFKKFDDKLLKKEICINCCHGAKVVTWQDGIKVSLYA